MNILETVFEYQTLHNQSRVGDPLSEQAEARRVGLERLLKGRIRSGEARRPSTRLPIPMPIQFAIGTGFAPGEVRNLSGGGAAIVTKQKPELGARTILRIMVLSEGIEYVYPGRIVWAQGSIVGVAFDGAPSKEPMPVDKALPWTSHFLFGLGADAPMVA